jgi:hypothetical protein
MKWYVNQDGPEHESSSLGRLIKRLADTWHGRFHIEFGPYTPRELRALKESGKLGPNQWLRPETDSRLIKASKTTLFWNEETQGGESKERPVNIETGFQPAPFGNLRAADGYAAAIRRLVFAFPRRIMICFATLVGLIIIWGVRQQPNSLKAVEENTSRIPESATKPKDLLGELGIQIERWKEQRAKAFTFAERLTQDRDGLRQQLQTLGVTTVGEGSRTPRGKVLLEELKDVLRQLVAVEKKHEEYDLAIFKSESRLRTVERRISSKNAGVSDTELEDLTRSMLALEDTLAKESAGELPLELDDILNRALLHTSGSKESK